MRKKDLERQVEDARKSAHAEWEAHKKTSQRLHNFEKDIQVLAPELFNLLSFENLYAWREWDLNKLHRLAERRREQPMKDADKITLKELDRLYGAE